MGKTLPEEPDGMSQICGYEMSPRTWSSMAAYCGELKADGLFFCQEHHNWVALDYEDGKIKMAPGNVRGHAEWQHEPRVRDVPQNSGEAAIYSPEFLRKREGNAYGTEPYEPSMGFLPFARV